MTLAVHRAVFEDEIKKAKAYGSVEPEPEMSQEQANAYDEIFKEPVEPEKEPDFLDMAHAMADIKDAAKINSEDDFLDRAEKLAGLRDSYGAKSEEQINEAQGWLPGRAHRDALKEIQGGGGGWGDEETDSKFYDYTTWGPEFDALLKDTADWLQTDPEKASGVIDFTFRALPQSALKTASRIGEFFFYSAPKSVLRSTFAAIDHAATLLDVDIGQARMGNGWYANAFYDDPVTGMQIQLQSDPYAQEIADQIAENGKGYLYMVAKPFGLDGGLHGKDAQGIFQTLTDNWQSDPAGCLLGLLALGSMTKKVRAKGREWINRGREAVAGKLRGEGLEKVLNEGIEAETQATVHDFKRQTNIEFRDESYRGEFYEEVDPLKSPEQLSENLGDGGYATYRNTGKHIDAYGIEIEMPGQPEMGSPKQFQKRTNIEFVDIPEEMGLLGVEELVPGPKEGVSKVKEEITIAEEAAKPVEKPGTVKEFKKQTGVKFYSNPELKAMYDAAVKAVEGVTKGVKKIKSKIEVNDSLNSAGASLEAIKRLKEMKAKGQEFRIYDTRTGKYRTDMSVNAVDYKVQPYEVKIQTKAGKGGADMILDRGEKVAKNWTIPKKSGTKLYSGLPVNELRPLVKSMWDRTQAQREWLADVIDVQNKYTRIGGANTGIAAKIRASVETMYEVMGLSKVKEIAATARESLFPGRKIMRAAEKAELINTYWEASKLAQYPEKLRAAPEGLVKEIATEVRTLMDEAKAALHDQGLTFDFKRRLHDELVAHLERSDLGPAERAQVQAALDKIADYDFVHAPTALWMEQAIRDPASQGKVIKLLNSKKRLTPTLEELVEAGHLTKEQAGAPYVIASYYRRLGRDMAMQDILNNAKAEGLMSDTHKMFNINGVEVPAVRLRGYEAPHLAKKWFHPAFADHLREIYLDRTMPRTAWGKGAAKVDRFISATKMLAFYNPVFLPMYDLVQAALIMGPHTYKLPSYVSKGFKDVWKKTPDYYEGQRWGLSSKPFPEPWNQFKRQVEFNQQSIYQNMLEMIDPRRMKKRALEGKGLERIPLLSDAYNLSWWLAWELDASIRQGTYRFLRDKEGMAPKEAAQTAALFHGDYASVPASTRRSLNRFLFTPTFKIAMGKLYYRMMKDAAKIPATRRLGLARGLVMAFAIQAAYDTLLTQGLGFKREQFGRRYVRETEDEKGMPKEFVMVFSNPANMWQKYYYRLKDAYHTPTPVANAFAYNFQELTPLLRVSAEIATGESMRTGKMYDWRFDSTPYIMKKALPYLASGIFGVFREASYFQTDKEKEARQMAGKELGVLGSRIQRLISFAYTRDPKNKRTYYKIKYLYSDFMKYIRKRAMEGEPFQKERVENFQKELNYYLKQLNE